MRVDEARSFRRRGLCGCRPTDFIPNQLSVVLRALGVVLVKYSYINYRGVVRD